MNARPESGQSLGVPVHESPERLAPPPVPGQLPRHPEESDAADARTGQTRPPAAEGSAPLRTEAGDLAADTGDPAALADLSGTEALLRCWVRENGSPAPSGALLQLPLDTVGAVLLVPVRHWSATGTHRFGPPLLAAGKLPPGPVDAVTLAALLVREAAHRGPGEGPYGAETGGEQARGGKTCGRQTYGEHGAALVARVADSVRRGASFLAERRAAPGRPAGVDGFLDAEQSLLLGHPLHPTPKSREGLTDAESLAYSPESRASFPLHWMAVSRSVLAADSAWTERGRTVPAEVLVRRLAGDELCGRLPKDTVPLPLHPWQARDLAHRPAVAGLLGDGLLHDLGPAGGPWYATSSLRTVMRPGTGAMLKLSLGLSITNSRRENLRKELLRGTEVHRLLRSGLGTRWRAEHPGFDVVRDPALLGVDGPYGLPVPGLDTVIRHNPFAGADTEGSGATGSEAGRQVACCVAGLTALRPWSGSPWAPLRSHLAETVRGLAARTGQGVRAVAAEWFLRYLDAVLRPVLWLDAHTGVALEAHQQNTLVVLDAEGWPVGGRYRDNQGYYFRAGRRAELQAWLPAARLGVASDSFVDDAVVDERFAYYLGINNLFGLIGAFGAQGLADEGLLLAALRGFLVREAAGGGAERGSPVSSLPALLLESPTLRCKANLLTRLQGMDELVGPVDTQSVYVTVRNPLAR